MRLLFAAALLLMLSGCNAPAQDVAGAANLSDNAPAPGPVDLGSATLQIGLPSGPVTDISAGLGLLVPADATRLTIVVEVRDGASVGLATTGVPGCEHAYADPQVTLDRRQYECTAEPGAHELEFRHGGGRLTFTVQVTARAA